MAGRFHHSALIELTGPSHSNAAPASERVVDPQDHDGADNGNDQAPDVEAGDAPSANRAEQDAADEGADDAEHEIGYKTGTAALHDLTRDPAGDEPKDDPGNDGHVFPLFID